MSDILPVLKTLKCATTVMSTEKDVSISSTYPVTFGLLNSHLQPGEDDSRRVLEFKTKAHASLKRRLKVGLGYRLYFISKAMIKAPYK